MRKPGISFVSLGCPKNSVDSEKALGALLSRGAVLDTDPRSADWIVVNTCGFIS
jgi:ribosomal protein S12 methylthiotransferase